MPSIEVPEFMPRTVKFKVGPVELPLLIPLFWLAGVVSSEVAMGAIGLGS